MNKFKPMKMKNNFTRINPMNIYKMIDGKKYQFMGLYPKEEDLQLDLERVHHKHGFILKFELLNNNMKVWRRKK